MANLQRTYQEVQDTIARNNAAKEDDGGTLFNIYQTIFPSLEKDLNPENIDKPLSGFGEILNSVTGFRKRQIETEAARQATLAETKYEALAPLRKRTRADNLDAQLTADKVTKQYNANNQLEAILPSVRADDITKQFIKSSVANKYSLFPSIKSSVDNQEGLKVYGENEEVPIQAGRLIFTSKDGRKLYSSSNKQWVNLNASHDRLGKEFRSLVDSIKIGEDTLTVEKVLQASPEEKQKYITHPDFKQAMQKIVGSIPPEVLQSHELYEAALTEKMGDINRTLKARSNYLAVQERQARDVYERSLKELGLKPNDRDANTKAKIAYNTLRGIGEKQRELVLDGSWKNLVRSKVFSTAFALSLLSGLQSTKESAKRHINQAMNIVRHDPELARYKEEHEAHYTTQRENLVSRPRLPIDRSIPEGSGDKAKPKEVNVKSKKID